MKKVSLLFAFVALFATASFAKSSIAKSTRTKTIKQYAVVNSSCTVRVKYGKYKLEVTYECACSQQYACEQAYKWAAGFK